MSRSSRRCLDCESPSVAPGLRIPAFARADWSRREFLRTAGAAAVAVAFAPSWAQGAEGAAKSTPETLVKTLFDALGDEQKQKVCFAWDYVHPERGLLRTHVANNWNITEPTLDGKFFTKDQKQIVREIFEGMLQPEWHAKIDKQLEDDAGGYGVDQSIAIFGAPGAEKFEFVMTGRHMTMRCDGNTAEHVAFGGPIFYGHAATGFDEAADHEGNVFWYQAQEANTLFGMLDGKQQEQALVASLPREQDVGFRGAAALPGLAVRDMSTDQREHVQKVLQALLDPYRQIDRDEVQACLKAQGGLEGCSLAFYSDRDIGADRVWDCWRLEGPAFVWYFRGAPHVHVWVNVADDPSVATNA